MFDDNANTLRKTTAANGATASLTYAVATSAYYVIAVEPTEFLAQGTYTLSIACASAPPPTACTANSTVICLSADRFAVSATWRTSDGTTGQGQAVRLTFDTGYFIFFSVSNVETVVKILNGCGINTKYWVFAGGLTNVNVVLTVRDTKTGTVRTYENALNTAFQPIQDTSAFSTCP